MQTTQLKLKGTAAKLCSAKSKANPTLCTFAARHGGASAFIGSLQTIYLADETCAGVRVRFVTTLASKLQRAYGNGKP